MARQTTPRELGMELRRSRLAAGLTQDELARSAHVSRAWLIRLEQGHANAELSKVFAVVRALGLTLEVSPAPKAQPAEIDLDELLEKLS